MDRKIKVTFPINAHPLLTAEMQDAYTTLTWTYPARTFEGDIRWSIHDGILSLLRMSEEKGCAETFITFAHGQWISAEFVT